MVEAGGGERTGTADRQNQQSSTNSSRATKRRRRAAAEQHRQQHSTERRSTTCCRTQRKGEGEPHQRATSIDDAEECGPYPPKGGASSRGTKRATLRRGT